MREGARVEWHADPHRRGQVTQCAGSVVWVVWDRSSSAVSCAPHCLKEVDPTPKDLIKWWGRWRTREDILTWLRGTPEWVGSTLTVCAGVATLTHPSGAVMTLRGFKGWPDRVYKSGPARR